MKRKKFKRKVQRLIGSYRLLSRQCITAESILVDTATRSSSELSAAAASTADTIDIQELCDNIDALREAADEAELNAQAARETADLLEEAKNDMTGGETGGDGNDMVFGGP